VQSWSYETVVRLLYTYWPEGYDLPMQEPTGLLARLQRRFAPSSPSLMTTTILDTLIGISAEASEDVRFVGLLLSILANEQARKEEEQVGTSQHWGTHFNRSLSGFNFGAEDIPSRIVYYPMRKNPRMAALSALLPLVTPANCDLSPRQRDALLIPLRYPYRDVDLTLSILVVLAWLGEKNSVETVKVVEEGSIETDNGRRIRVAARACREQIALRVNKNRQAQTLLRAADPDTISSPNTLLRPLPNSESESCPEELLRPAN